MGRYGYNPAYGGTGGSDGDSDDDSDVGESAIDDVGVTGYDGGGSDGDSDDDSDVGESAIDDVGVTGYDGGGSDGDSDDDSDVGESAIDDVGVTGYDGGGTDDSSGGSSGSSSGDTRDTSGGAGRGPSGSGGGSSPAPAPDPDPAPSDSGSSDDGVPRDLYTGDSGGDGSDSSSGSASSGDQPQASDGSSGGSDRSETVTNGPGNEIEGPGGAAPPAQGLEQETPDGQSFTPEERAITNQAQDLQQQVLEENPNFDESDVRVVRGEDGETIQAELTREARAEAVERQALEQNPDLEEGDLRAVRGEDDSYNAELTREARADAIKEQVLSQYPNLDEGDVNVVSGDDGELVPKLTDSARAERQDRLEDIGQSAIDNVGIRGYDPGQGDSEGSDPSTNQQPEPDGEDAVEFGPGPTTRGGLGEADPGDGEQFPVAEEVAEEVATAETDQDVVDRFTTGGLLSERGESAGLFTDEATVRTRGGDVRVDISETRLREGAENLSEAGEKLDIGAYASANAALVYPLTGGRGVNPSETDLDPTTDSGGESAVENFLEGAAQLPFDVPGGVLQGETAVEVVQATAEGGIEEEGRGDVAETGVAVGRDASVATATAAQQNPAEFAGGVGAGLLLGGAGAASAGTASSGLRAALRAEVDPRVGTFGTTIETRTGRGVRDFLRDDRGQADPSGVIFGRDTDGSDVDDSATQLEDVLDEEAQPIASTNPELDDARSQQFDQITFEAERRRAETRRENDLEDVARDPDPETVDNRAGSSEPVNVQEDVYTASRDPDTSRSGPTPSQREAFRGSRTPSDLDSDVDLSPRESQLAAQLETPETDLRTRVDADSDQGTDTAAATSTRVDADTGADTVFGSLFGAAAGADTGFDSRGDSGIDTDIFGREDTGIDVRQDTPTALDVGPDIDVFDRVDLPSDLSTDPGDGPDFDSDTDLRDPRTTDPTTSDPNDPNDPSDPGDPNDPSDRDSDIPLEFDEDGDGYESDALFVVDSEVFDTGVVQSLSELR